MLLSPKRIVIFAVFFVVLVGGVVWGLEAGAPMQAARTSLPETPETVTKETSETVIEETPQTVTEEPLETDGGEETIEDPIPIPSPEPEPQPNPTPNTGPIVSVHPKTNTPTVGDNFTINVTISNVTDLQGYEFKLAYNTSILTATEITVGNFFSDYFLIKKEICQLNKFVWLAVHVPLGSQEGVSGSGTLAKINFKVKSTGSCILNLYDTKFVSMVRPSSPTIHHEVEDGYFECKIHEHDLTVFLDAPNHFEPGDSSLLNATVVNQGLYNETDVELQLLIDDNVVNSAVVSFLQVRTSYTLNYVWTPTVEKTYNVTAYATPVSGEGCTSNNVISARVVVRPPIRVPEDYSTIREAVDSAVSGEVILVASGVYYEQSLTIDKSVTLVGENSSTTIIDGNGTKEMIIYVVADHVSISGFTIRNGFGGVLLDHSDGHNFVGNTITNTHDSLSLLFSHECSIIANTIKNNYNGITLGSSNHNTIHHNNFINNTVQVWCLDAVNIWDNGAGEGNYWSNYNGTDLDGDGIGDEYLPWEQVDYYPFMSPVTTVDMWIVKTSN